DKGGSRRFVGPGSKLRGPAETGTGPLKTKGPVPVSAGPLATMALDGTVVLATQNVCKYYRRGGAREVRAVEGASLSISAGSFTALTGPSGSGKTTLLALLGALERPSSGQVFFQGRDLGGFSDVALARVRRRLGFVFQDFSLIPGLT